MVGAVSALVDIVQDAFEKIFCFTRCELNETCLENMKELETYLLSLTLYAELDLYSSIKGSGAVQPRLI